MGSFCSYTFYFLFFLQFAAAVQFPAKKLNLIDLPCFCFWKSPQDTHGKTSRCVPHCKYAVWSAAMVTVAVCTADFCILAYLEEQPTQPPPLPTEHRTRLLRNRKQTVSLCLLFFFIRLHTDRPHRLSTQKHKSKLLIQIFIYFWKSILVHSMWKKIMSAYKRLCHSWGCENTLSLA